MKMTFTQAQGRVPVAVLRLNGDLDGSSYQSAIAGAKSLYDKGARYMVLDLSNVPYMSSAGIVALQSISTLLPITPGGVGTVQGLLVVAFKGKVAASTVLGFSVGMHVAIVLSNLVVGFSAIGLMLRTFRWRRFVRPEERLAEQ